MRVLYWVERFWPHIGGVEVLSRQLLQALRGRGHEILVLTARGPGEAEADTDEAGVQIRRLPFQRPLARRDLGELRTLAAQVAERVRDFQPDVLHLNTSQPSLFVFERIRASLGAPVLFTVHEPPAPAPAGNSLLGRVLGGADWVSAVSQAMLAAARALVPGIAARSSVLYNGLRMPELAPTSLPFAPPRLLGVGRLIRDKGFDLALEALVRLRLRFPGTTLTLVGDGPARAELERQAAAAGLAGAVTFLGWRRPGEMPALINAATVVLVPSRWPEPFGLAALEAAQMARPVVAAGVGGLPEVVRHGETGLLCEADNAAALADQAAALLAQPAVAARMGVAARRRAEREFGLDRLLDGCEDRYRRLAAAAARHPAEART
jgi:glycogen(starch) synthase